MRATLSCFAHGQSIYFMHVVGLVSPGRQIPVFRAHQIEHHPLGSNWTDDDLERMLDEGHDQLDRQLSDLERIRGRAQWLFTVSAALTAALGSAFLAERPHDWLLALWLAGLVVVAYGVAGAAAVMTVRADFGTIDTAKLSQEQPPMLRYLAGAYSRMLATGENTVATSTHRLPPSGRVRHRRRIPRAPLGPARAPLIARSSAGGGECPARRSARLLSRLGRIAFDDRVGERLSEYAERA